MKTETTELVVAPGWLTEFESPERWLEPLSAIYEVAGLDPEAARRAAQADLQYLAQCEKGVH